MKKKFLASLVRTFIAIVLIRISILVLMGAVHWYVWIPNNDFGVVFVLLLYTMAIGMLTYGIYLISPIYMGKLFHYIFSEKLGNDLPESAAYDEEEEEDSEDYYEDDENDFMSKFVNFIAKLGNDTDEEEDDDYQEDEESYEERMERLKRKYLW